MSLIACHECDTLHRRTPLAPGAAACCTRCGGVLYRQGRADLEQHLALVLGGLIVFILANAYPIISLELQGYRNGSTLFGAVLALHDEGMSAVAALVLLTAIVFPLAELLLLLAILLPLLRGHAGSALHARLRWLQRVRPWGMLDVFLMAVLVALVKLAHTATVIPGVALWAFAVLAFLMAATAAIDPRELWQQADALTRDGGAPDTPAGSVP